MVGPTVMVVEDDPGMLEIIEINLEHAGYDVTPAQDGVEAFRTLEQAKPDAVILDLNVPRMSGFRFAKLLRRDPMWRRTPLIVVTGYAFEEVEDLTNEGIQGFLRKPFDPAALVESVRNALDGGVTRVLSPDTRPQPSPISQDGSGQAA